MFTLADMGLKVWVSLFGFLDGFDSFCLDLFGCFGFFGFPYGFLIFSNVHLIPRKGSDVDTLLC